MSDVDKAMLEHAQAGPDITVYGYSGGIKTFGSVVVIAVGFAFEDTAREVAEEFRQRGLTLYPTRVGDS